MQILPTHFYHTSGQLQSASWIVCFEKLQFRHQKTPQGGGVGGRLGIQSVYFDKGDCYLHPYHLRLTVTFGFF